MVKSVAYFINSDNAMLIGKWNMEFLFELIFELIFEGSIEASSNRKLSKWIRYPLIVIISVFYLGLIALFIMLGVKLFDETKLGSVSMIAIGLFLLIVCILAFRKIYLKKNKKG